MWLRLKVFSKTAIAYITDQVHISSWKNIYFKVLKCQLEYPFCDSREHLRNTSLSHGFSSYLISKQQLHQHLATLPFLSVSVSLGRYAWPVHLVPGQISYTYLIQWTLNRDCSAQRCMKHNPLSLTDTLYLPKTVCMGVCPRVSTKEW